jgi:hypothetical protein
MPLPSTMTPIASMTLTSTASSISFSNIPQGYTDLKIIASVKQSADSPAYIQFNGDSGGNYSTTNIGGDGSSYASQRISNWGNGIWYRSELISEGSYFGLVEIDINNYQNSSVYKTIISRASVTSGTNTVMVGGVAGLWRSNAAITYINFYPASTTWESGSTITLYGIKAA